MSEKQKPPFHEEILTQMRGIIQNSWYIPKKKAGKPDSEALDPEIDGPQKCIEFQTYLSVLKKSHIPYEAKKKVVIKELRRMVQVLLEPPKEYIENEYHYFYLLRVAPQDLLKLVEELEKELETSTPPDSA